MDASSPQPKSNRSTLWIVLLILSALLNIYQWVNQDTIVTGFEQKVDTLVVERVNIDKELAETRSELEKYRGISANLDSVLSEADRKISEQEQQIRQITKSSRNSAELAAKLKTQLSNLQELRDEYLTRIDSLITENQKLQAEKQQLTGTVESLSKNLETTVSTASALKAEYLKVTAYKRKSNGTYTVASLAKRTHKLDVCFDILENKIARPGDKTVYLKITEPGGKPIGNKGTGSGTFKTSSGEEMMYAASNTINYTGERQNVCLNFEEQQDKMFPTGTYLVEIFIDGNPAGNTSYVLK
jgi:predicted  nucleic acid-binding Zn-ribbon protein